VDGVPVVVVDASPLLRRSARTALEVAGEFTVVGEARTAAEAVAVVARLRPRAVLLGLDLPGGALEALEQIMARTPTPVVVWSDCAAGPEALAAGAVEVLLRADDGPGADALRRCLRVAARVRVITHPRGRLVQRAPAPPAVRLVAVGSSSGGPRALATVLGALPADLGQAVLVVQHMAEGFLEGLAAWLDSQVPLRVLVGEGGGRLCPGTVTLAPSGGNLLLTDDRLRVHSAPPLPSQFHVPGIDATFTSVAEVLGPAAIGVVLTGMGRDGAAGLAAMQARGARTIGQDEGTSAVYGMPAAAHAAGAVDVQLPLEQIGPALLALVGRTP